jgi:translation elongation factor EF-Ts
LDNLRLSDLDFAKILKSISELKSFKSLIYRQNEFGVYSEEYLSKIINKKVPNHLEELRIENCRVNLDAMESLITTISEQGSLRQLALVQAKMTAETFGILGSYLKSAQYMVELDISNNSFLHQESYTDFLRNISKNNLLRDINLSHN